MKADKTTTPLSDLAISLENAVAQARLFVKAYEECFAKPIAVIKMTTRRHKPCEQCASWREHSQESLRKAIAMRASVTLEAGRLVCDLCAADEHSRRRIGNSHIHVTDSGEVACKASELYEQLSKHVPE
jgi:hypothetical protein